MHNPFSDQKRIKEQAGAVQVPMIELEDGRWMSDSTPIIAQLEKEHPEPAIMPEDEVVRFVSLRIEDYAAEWSSSVSCPGL